MRKLLNCGHNSDKANRTSHPYKPCRYSCPVFLGSEVHLMHAGEIVGFCGDFFLVLGWTQVWGVALFVVVGEGCLFICFNGTLYFSW